LEDKLKALLEETITKLLLNFTKKSENIEIFAGTIENSEKIFSNINF
jgi:hypothetical protein